jgi:hypothetical protein
MYTYEIAKERLGEKYSENELQLSVTMPSGLIDEVNRIGSGMTSSANVIKAFWNIKLKSDVHLLDTQEYLPIMVGDTTITNQTYLPLLENSNDAKKNLEIQQWHFDFTNYLLRELSILGPRRGDVAQYVRESIAQGVACFREAERSREHLTARGILPIVLNGERLLIAL